jgi:hypothetical protein
MTPQFRALIDNKALSGDIGALDDIQEALVAHGELPEELAYTVMAKEQAVQVLAEHLELALGLKQAS